VPEHILSKCDALTPEEFERVKIHPRVGAEILGNVPFAGPVNELVLCHHERWDGLGYPGGLRGAEIPLGARVLAIADCFSALQSDRPYRPQRNEAAALAVIWEHSGTAYDPSLVELLTSRLHVGGPVTEQATAPSGELALQDIAGAHREAQTLYEIAQALGSSLGVAEAMALIQQKMSRLIPFVTCALFLGDDEHGYSCRYAHGPGTEALFKSTPKSWNELSLRIPVCADGRAGHGEDLASVLACPLRFSGRLIGGIVIYHMVDDCFTDEHRRVLERVSDQAAAVIYNSTRFDRPVPLTTSFGSTMLQANCEQLRVLRRGLAPYDSGRQYLNFAGDATNVSTFYKPEAYRRLQAVKGAVDPDNVFRANHPIPTCS